MTSCLNLVVFGFVDVAADRIHVFVDWHTYGQWALVHQPLLHFFSCVRPFVTCWSGFNFVGEWTLSFTCSRASTITEWVCSGAMAVWSAFVGT
jgi:hypothetical protein